MNTVSVGIKGLGFEVGENVVTNHDLAKFLDTNDDWIKEKIGISERKHASKDKALSDLALIAAKKALKAAGIDARELDLIIVSTITPDHTNVSTACLLQNLLGADKAAAFDISNGGCPGSVYSLVTGSKFIADGTYKNVLVIAGEIYSKFVNWKDRSICVYFGDGVGAAVLQPVEEGYGILAHTLGADGSGYNVLAAPAGGSRMPINEEILKQGLNYAKMDGKSIWEFATRVFPESVAQSAKKANIEVSDIDFLISHQANINIIKVGMEKLGLPMTKTYTNIDRYGNTGGASVFIALTEAVDKGLIKRDDNLALVAFGGGLAYGSIIIRWF